MTCSSAFVAREKNCRGETGEDPVSSGREPEPGIGRGLVRREPAIDWSAAQRFIPDATPDIEVLQFAADNGRVLVTRDVTTVPRYFAAFVATRSSPGVILIPSATIAGEAIERLLVAWVSWAAEDIENQIWWLPATTV